jgi:hypothetical protein
VEENDGYYEAYWPRSPREVNVKPLAARLEVLNGKRIALPGDWAAMLA